MSVRTEEEIEKEHDSDVAEEDEENEDRSMNKFGINGGIGNGGGRTVTLQMLLAASMLQPGKSTMTIEYLGQKFIGDLLPDGKIKSQETETIFCSPSAWAMHCKRIINPDKKSGCGWASVKYKGKKLDAYKATWLRKCQLQKDSTTSDGEGENDLDKKEMTPPPPIKRLVVPHNTVNNRNIPHDANTLVEAVPFSSLGKIQPFLVSMSKSALFLMDFHCHLTRNEVCGYLGGTWDFNAHNLLITHAFPCRNTKHDREKSTEVELNIQRAMLKKNLTLLGWYHSHPRSPAQPTFRDCDTQLEYQIKMKGPSDATYSPCIGVICSPYNDDNQNMVSTFMAYWILPPPEHRPMEYGRPMTMSYNVTQDTNVSDFIRNEMELLVTYYRNFDKELINFGDLYRDENTFMEKLKNSLYLKFPKEETDETFWNFIRELLGLEREEIFERPISAPEEKPIDVDQKSEDDEDKKSQTQSQLQQTQNSIISLQQQLSLPSGLNMNPSILGSNLVIPTVGSTHSTTSSSPRDSPITISSNAPSPGKFEIPIRASPSPAKSDTSSTKTRNSPAPSPNKFNVSDVPRNSPNVTPSLPQYDLGNASGLASDSMNEFLTASLASLVGKLPPGMQPSELAILFQQKLAEYGVTGFNPMVATAAIIPKTPTVPTSSSASSKSYKDIYKDLDKYDMNYLLQSQYNSMALPPQKTSKSKSSSKRNYDSGMSSTSVSSVANSKSHPYMDLDMDQKAELSKLSDFMKSPEYASLLMQQATGYGGIGSYGLGSEISVSKKSSKKSHFTSSDLSNFLQASSKIPDLSSLLHGGKMSDYGSPMSTKKCMDYASLLEHHKLPDLTSITPISSGNSGDGSSVGGIPGVPDLSALFAPVLGGKKLEAGSSAANSGSANDMLSSLLQAGKSSELNSLLFAQGKADLSSYFAAPSPSSSTSSKSGIDHGSVYSNISPVKSHDISSLFQHTKYPGIPDPLAKSTLAANNMYMGPSSSLLKLQQEAINAMMMKPPKATTPLSSLSSSSGGSTTVVRSTETPPSSFERHSTSNKSNNRESPHLTSNPNLKYNFSAADLAVSSISDYSRKPSATSPVDMSNLAGHNDPPPKKRAEFSSIADLVAPPPTKIAKMDEIDIRGSPGVLNLSSSD